jgi:hypothetical protein
LIQTPPHLLHIPTSFFQALSQCSSLCPLPPDYASHKDRDYICFIVKTSPLSEEPWYKMGINNLESKETELKTQQNIITAQLWD